MATLATGSIHPRSAESCADLIAENGFNGTMPIESRARVKRVKGGRARVNGIALGGDVRPRAILFEGFTRA
jgi:hypothetical protein